MQLLGNPQDTHPSVHIAATSGKGSICHLIETTLRAHGQQTGMIESPHVYDIRERIQINGKLIDKKAFTKALNDVLEKISKSGIRLSYFEVLVAMGFTVFASNPLDYTIVETGLGGRLDATNVITRQDKICVLGQIGLDHTEALGDTLEKIATEKAGIVQEGNHVVALKQNPEVNKVFKKRCEEKNAEIEWVESTGNYQKDNEAMARKVCQILATRDGWNLDDKRTDSAMEKLLIPGRYEIRHYKDHVMILDGAHNSQKLAALADRIQREKLSPATIIVAFGERKDIATNLAALIPIAKRVIATEYFTKEQDIPKRPTPVNTILEACRLLNIPGISSISPEQALQEAVKFSDRILITGSFYLLGEMNKLI